MSQEVAPTEEEPTEAQLEAVARLRDAIRRRDPAVTEHAINVAYRAGLHLSMSAPMIELAESFSHMRHEDLVLALQRLRSADAVDVLERLAAANYEYLDYDEFNGLARKCTWALADIGTSPALDALTRLATSSNPRIAAYASKRLARWDEEQDRKLARP